MRGAGPRWVARLVFSCPPLFDEVAAALVRQSVQQSQSPSLSQSQARIAPGPGLAARADALRALAALDPQKRPLLMRLLV